MNKNVILLIEDEEKLSRTLAEYLELNGYRVLRALNGLEGLSMFYDHMHEVDLILLDMVMPGVSGMELLKVLKKSENWSNISVIFLTSLEGVDIELEGFTNGASDFLQKPVNAELLRLKIKRQLFIQDLKAENQHLQKTLQTLHSRIDQIFNEVLS